MTDNTKGAMTAEEIVDLFNGKTFSGPNEALEWLRDKIIEAETQAFERGFNRHQRRASGTDREVL